MRGRFAFLFLLLLTSGCASYSSRVAHPRSLMETGQFDQAETELKKLADNHDNDELLYLLDLGMAYHEGGKYREAITTFLAAEKFAEQKDYVSISQEAGAVVLNDQVKVYKGEDFEKILINVYLAIDYTLLHEWDDALVECRQVDHKLDVLIAAGKITYDRNAFAKYLAAALFDARGEYNDALVDYRQLYRWIGDGFPYLGAPLLRMASKVGDATDVDEYRAKFPEVKQFRLPKNYGEIILIVEQGRAPLKAPAPGFNLIPVFRKRFYSSDYAWAQTTSAPNAARSYPLFDIEKTAISELKQKMALIVTKKIGGVVVKEAAAYGVAQATHSELLGALTSIALHASDHADLRSWTTLPARLQLIRFAVPAGRQDVSLDLVNNYGTREMGVKRWTNLDVKPGETLFLDYRTRD